MLKIAKKSFINTRILSFTYLTFLIFSLYYCIKIIRESRDDILFCNSRLLYFSMFAFVLFTFIAFEFCSKCKNNGVEECLLSTKSGYVYFLKSQVIFLIKLAVIFNFIMLIFNIVLCMQNEIYNSKFIVEMLLGVLLNYFLIPVMGICFGVFFALFSKRLIAYLLLVLITLLSSPFMNDIALLIYESTEVNVFPAFKMLDFFTPSLNWTPVYAFGHTILPYRWATVGFWCLLLIGLSIYKVLCFDYE